MKQNMDKLVIMDHFKFPHNKTKPEDTTYLHQHGLNPSCGDQVDIYLKINHDQTIDVKWEGSGCSICMASASIMSEELNGLSIKEAIDKIDNFEQMITGHDCNVNLFVEAQALNGLDQFPSRFKCGDLAWSSVKELLVNQS